MPSVVANCNSVNLTWESLINKTSIYVAIPVTIGIPSHYKWGKLHEKQEIIRSNPEPNLLISTRIIVYNGQGEIGLVLAGH